MAEVIIAFDYGERHIGVATGQTLTSSATPLKTLPARNGVPDWSAVRRLVEDWQPQLLVVGLPLNMDGSESEMSARARAFADALEKETGLPTLLADERLTSFEAKGLAADDNHAVAAALIAETWLRDDKRRS